MKIDTIKTKLRNLETKIDSVTTLIYINQYNTDKQGSEKKLLQIDKNFQIRGV